MHLHLIQQLASQRHSPAAAAQEPRPAKVVQLEARRESRAAAALPEQPASEQRPPPRPAA